MKYDKLSRRRFKNKFSELDCILLRKTSKHLYLSLRRAGFIITEVNTLKMRDTPMKEKAEFIKTSLSKIKNEYNVNKHYTDIFLSSPKGYVKYILSDAKQ